MTRWSDWGWHRRPPRRLRSPITPLAAWLSRPAPPESPVTQARNLGTLANRLLPWAVAATLIFGLGACAEGTGPVEPPYIAVIPVISAAPGTDVGAEYTYRITEISGTLNIDEVRRVSPQDTVIVPVKPATYRITISGLPSHCRVRDGPEIYLLVPEGSNTAVWRYQISCESLITLTTGTDGPSPDAAYVWSLRSGGATARSGILEANDTLLLDGFAPGDYELELAHVADNCVVTSDGGRRQRFAISGAGGSRADFRVVCSDPAKRPSILLFHSSYHDGTSGFMFRAADPDGDVERYFWDITDCSGKSVLADGGRQRRGLLVATPAGPDTITVFGAIELGLPDQDLLGRCTSLRVQDEYGNSTPILEEPIGNEAGTGPLPDRFNARFATTASLTTELAISAADFAGVFAAARLRDGVLFPADGRPDVGVFNATGFEDTLIPTVPLGGGRPPYYDYSAVILYLFDAEGNFTRLEDADLFQ